MARTFKHILAVALLWPLAASGQAVDLLAAGEDAWQSFDRDRWQFTDGELRGRTAVLDGDKTDPAASTFLVSRRKFSGDYIVSLDVTFDEGRYLGVYLDFGQDTQSGMWLATGHALPPDAPDNEVERGYIKTVDKGAWVVRATGELVIEKGKPVRLGFSRHGDDYSLWNDGRLIAVYRKEGGYPAGPLQIRLTNAAVRIHGLRVRTGKNKR